MKKPHLIILIITAIMALFSAYSLAAINQVYNVEFEWFSQYNNSFRNDVRDTSYDKWYSAEHPEEMKLTVIRNYLDYLSFEKEMGGRMEQSVMKRIMTEDYEKYITICCSLGNVESLEYRVKIDEIAQRGNVVEVKVSMNSPVKEEKKGDGEKGLIEQVTYKPMDLVRINKEALASKGGLYFIFKNQSGKQIDEQYYDIK
ncbi:MAG: hypothetical protein N3I35_16300 [Clostridia bacterium]|nr:hypothetical protein [Clostridia bacterium]